jgi:hypothetical protein
MLITRGMHLLVLAIISWCYRLPPTVMGKHIRCMLLLQLGFIGSFVEVVKAQRVYAHTCT